MGLLRLLCGRGDVKVTWTLDEQEAVAEAERICRENAARGYAAFRVDDGVAEAPLRRARLMHEPYPSGAPLFRGHCRQETGISQCDRIP